MVIATQLSLDLAMQYCRHGAASGDFAWLDDVDRILSRLNQTSDVSALRSFLASGRTSGEPELVFQQLHSDIGRLMGEVQPPPDTAN